MEPVKSNTVRREAGFLAVCGKCDFKTKFINNLTTHCIKCKEVFGVDVKKVKDPFDKPRRASSAKTDESLHPIKQEPVSTLDEQTSLKTLKREPIPVVSPNPEFETNNCETSSAEVATKEAEDRERVLLSDGLSYENRLRVIHSSNNSRSIMFQINSSSSSSEGNILYEGDTNAEDTIIQEFRLRRKLHKIRLMQVTPHGAQVILQDSTYTSFLQEMIFSCPCALSFMHQMLNMVPTLTSVRFGQLAFNLCVSDDETPVKEPSGVKANNLIELHMSFDRHRYNQYDGEGKDIVRDKITGMLRVASTAFPNLLKCDILIPEEIESELDFFLSAKPDIKRLGTKRHNYEENSISFCTDISTKCAKTRDEIDIDKDKLSTSKKGTQLNTETEVLLIDLSSDEEVQSNNVMASSSLTKDKSTSKTKNTSDISVRDMDSESYPLIWNTEPDGIHGCVAPCSKCGAYSKNLHNCSKCEYLFPPNTKVIQLKEKRLPAADTAVSSSNNLATSTSQHSSLDSYENNSRKRSAPTSCSNKTAVQTKQSKTHEENSTSRTSTAPRFIDGMVKKCLSCKRFSKDLYMCSRCKKSIPSTNKILLEDDVEHDSYQACKESSPKISKQSTKRSSKTLRKKD